MHSRPQPTRVFLVEDQSLILDLLKGRLTAAIHCEVVGVASTGEAAIRGMGEAKPDVAIVDVGLPDIDGFQVVERARKEGSVLKIIMLTAYCNMWVLYQAGVTQVNALVDKSAGFVQLIQAFEAVMAGRAFMASAFSEISKTTRADRGAFDKLLSSWQITILRYIGAFWSNEEIAAKLGSTPGAIEKQRSTIRDLLSLKTARELVHFARANGFSSCIGTPMEYLEGNMFRRA